MRWSVILIRFINLSRLCARRRFERLLAVAMERGIWIAVTKGGKEAALRRVLAMRCRKSFHYISYTLDSLVLE